MQTFSERKLVDRYRLKKVSTIVLITESLLNSKNLWLTIILLCFSQLIIAQKHSVSGVVADAEGNKLIGVTISVKDLDKGTATSLDGAFTIADVRSEDVLVFSYIGMITKEVPVGNATNLEVILEENAKILEEVVVVGYGTQKMGTSRGQLL